MNFTDAQQATTASALAAAYARRELTPTQVAERCLARAQTARGVFTQLTVSRALAQAERATARWRAGTPLGPMDGVPLTWKDLFDIRGTPTTAGSALLAHAEPAKADATLVAHAEAAGMVCIGKTNLSEFAYSGLGLNPFFGTPVNPALGTRARAPGGSSSGAALAVALGIAPIGIGTDTAGSVRVPASFNGLVGYRASRLRHAMTGVFALAPSLDTVGPLAHSVADCIAMDAVLQGGRGDEARELLAGGFDAARRTLAQQTFVVDPAILDSERVTTAVRENLRARMRWLRAAGATVVEREAKSLHLVQALIDNHGWLGASEAFAIHQARLDAPQAEAMDPRVRRRLEAARDVSAARYLHLRWERQRLIAAFERDLEGATLVLPATAHTAPLLQPLEADDELFARTNLATLRLTMPGSFLDTPAVAMPSGVERVAAPDGSTDLLPTGLQLMRPRGEDARLLQIALSLGHLFSSPHFKEQ
ncbi:amidase [Variovorax sp. PDC80]|uniref:amidase n=1 Tax=Variovorax sp. PDC80 TaxID=1882827 RepID=UPI002108C505|nr:amidase [Variovorax sp. PDC80]